MGGRIVPLNGRLLQQLGAGLAYLGITDEQVQYLLENPQALAQLATAINNLAPRASRHVTLEEAIRKITRPATASRVINTLKRETGATYLDELTSYCQQEILKMRDIDRTGLQVIETALEQYGLGLAHHTNAQQCIKPHG